MQILYDGIIYKIQKYGGVSNYFNQLIGNLSATVNPHLLAQNRPHRLPNHPNLTLSFADSASWLKILKPLQKYQRASEAYRIYQQSCPDILHPTYYCSTFRSYRKRMTAPTVVTVYDMIHERFPERTDVHGKHALLKKEAIHSADAIVCISESTKSDLLNIYDVPESRVRVIYLASDFENAFARNFAYREGSKSIELPGERYFLFIGERLSYKNFHRLLKAMSTVKRHDPKVQLKCVGGKPLSQQEHERISALGLLGSVHHCSNVNDTQLKQIYRDSIGLVYPSLCEGFGIPILEAMHLGVPVLTSNCSSMAEVASDAAFLFDPTSVKEISDAMIFSLEDAGAREQMISRGKKRASEFSWKKTADETLRLYESVSGFKSVAA